MGANKELATKRATPRRKSENEQLAEHVKVLEATCLKLYDLGVPLRDAFRLTTLLPKFTFDIFRPSEGYFGNPARRSAFRSACWRMKVQEGIDDESCCYVHLLLGPYQDELTKAQKSYKAWLTDLVLMPFNFRSMSEEVGEGDQYYLVYQSTLPVPRSVLEQIIALLCVPKAILTTEAEITAFNLLEPHFTN